MKKIAFALFGLLIVISFLFGCVTVPSKTQTVIHKIEISVAADSPQKVTVKEPKADINRSMVIPNQEGSLSHLSFISNGKAYIKIFSALTVGDVTNLWNDIVVLSNTPIRTINVFINSPGGDAFSGLALADHIVRAKRLGFHVTGHASGIVASAAVPVFAVCDERLVAPGTIFMVHETSIWKWPGRETASDIRSQNRLMNMLRDRYIGLLVEYSNLTKTDWEAMEVKTTWFNADFAVNIGLADRIE